ncbi:MAG: glycosyltransferase [Nitrospirae bacterium]|nr:glycosyltransferase [Nitrospirota bacterium]
MIKYSIIVPAYNANNTIGECLNALVHQSIDGGEYEVIVVDDGSTDNTAGIIKKFPVKYIWQPNKGPAATRNHGAKEAVGDIILFTDSDCVPNRNWIEEMVKPFGSLDVVAVKGAYKTNQKSLTARFAQAEFEERFEMLKKAESIDMVDTYSAAFKRDIFRKMDGFDESFPVANNEDTDLSYKLSSAGCKMVFNPNAIVFHLRHPDTVRKYMRQKFWRGYWRMVVYKRFPGKMVKDTYTPQSMKFQIMSLFPAIFFVILSTVSQESLYFAAIAMLSFIISTLPFSLSTIGKDFTVGLLSTFFLAIRAFSIGSGILYYFYTRIR